MDLAFRTATGLARALRSAEVSSVELLDLYAERVARLNPRINAVVATDWDAARKRAREADAALARGESWGPLHGLPMTIKDAYEVVGMPATSGAPELADHRPTTHATAVQRLIDAGAVVFGKTNLPLWASDLQSYNEVYGTTNNPWDVTRGPGGSSGGAGAALAAGLTPLELGSDIGGSIRNPAHFNGVYGLKPSHGLVPVRGHIPGPPGVLAEGDLGVAGPMARSAEDLDLALDVLASPDETHAAAWRLELPEPRAQRLRDFRVAAWLDDPLCPVDSDVRERLAHAVAALRDAGVKVDEKARPEIDAADSRGVYLRLLSSVTTAGVPPAVIERMREAATRLSPADDGLAANMTRGAVLSHRDWLSDNERRAKLRARWADFFRDYDILLCPAAPTAAFPHDHSNINTRTIRIDGKEHAYFDQIFWAGLTTLVYLPSTVAPVGLAASGLPVGIQIVSGFCHDRSTTAFARALGEIVGGFQVPPGFE